MPRIPIAHNHVALDAVVTQVQVTEADIDAAVAEAAAELEQDRRRADEAKEGLVPPG